MAAVEWEDNVLRNEVDTDLGMDQWNAEEMNHWFLDTCLCRFARPIFYSKDSGP